MNTDGYVFAQEANFTPQYFPLYMNYLNIKMHLLLENTYD